MPITSRAYVEATDRLDRVHQCWSALRDLLNPEPDLHTVNRGDLTALTSLLVDEQAAAQRDLDQARHKEQQPC